MKIETYILAHNEEFMLPYAIRHYKQFSDIIVLENNSTDKTVEIALKAGAKVIQLDIPDEKDNEVLSKIKDNAWRKSKADWVIVVDCDEFLYHPYIKNLMSNCTGTILRSTWCEMYSETTPTGEGQIYEEVNKGLMRSKYGAKLAIFNPKEIESMNWGVGCHKANPIGNVIYENTEILTLHFRHLSLEYVLKRNFRDSVRLSKYNRLMGWSQQYDFPLERIKKHYDESLLNSKQIL